MDKHALEVLEFDKIKEQLREHTTSKIGNHLVEKLSPSTDLEFIESRQQEVTEATKILSRESAPPFGGIYDIRSALKKVEKGAILGADELLDILITITSGKKLRSYFLGLEDEDNEYVRILKISSQIETFSNLEQKIRKAVDNQGQIKDSASSKLADLRRKIRNTSDRIKNKLNSILNSNRYQSYIQESVVTIRDQRYVIPVKAAKQSDFPGIIHDKSASGQTVFIEPMPVVEINNKLQQLRSEEEEEIKRILQELSIEVEKRLQPIKETIKVLAVLDFIFAKAKYSIELEASEPILNSKGQINLIKARHPLLTEDVVPIDVQLGDNFASLVITGPNTGGKTVSLKTIGLLTIMGQAGLHVPALSGSKLAIFNQVYADIGDEQSIEQNLSTFSSHMTQIIKIVERASINSLVLLDELGAGTDPVEGSALARGILDYLHQQGAKTVATTHYSELKTYAYNQDGVENASVEFDVETLAPTYNLQMGLPGRSNAFQIASRLGLSDEIIDKASQFLDQEDIELDNIIKQIEEDKREYQQKKESAQENKRQARELREEYEAKLKKLEAQKEREMKEAYREANKIIKRAQQKANKIIDELKEQRQLNDRKIEGARSELREERKDLKEERQELIEAKREQKEVPDIKVGDKVKLSNLNQKGKVLEIHSGKEEALVQAGIMKVTVDLRELEKTTIESKTNNNTRVNISQVKSNKAKNISPELDLRGLRVVEAKNKLDKYLDDALLANLNQVEIIHGKGTGTLREVVDEMLKNYRNIKDYRLGRPKEGGTGVTIVNLG
ncbi:MutS2 family protein [Halobacteroides halobius DSM 5150]|uniref:Endonuclease MutS2 n=1 Tax=Halobacteroides halobius (strain ATCC 35273 / DSM 5150 / MD-1) TaxID=748449 RepID=L0K9J9_HALHC|nr:endonuclease MutS2 [Halobacteroides halobius]AGB41967.1 MutS2 family protein [Halobacteroides halobius DSM 5150]